MIRSSNPAFGDTAMDRIRSQADDVLRSPSEPSPEAPTARSTETMTIMGASLKTLSMFGLVMIAASVTWNMAMAGSASANLWTFGGAIGALIVGITTCFMPRFAPVTAPIYAILQGLFLGGISAFYEVAFSQQAQNYDLGQSIVFQAVMLTVAVAATMAALYAFRIIRVTAALRAVITTAVGAIMVVYLIAFAMRLFGGEMPFLHESTPIGIGISVVIVGVAAFSLLLDFDFIERGAAEGMPKWAEWYAAFGLMVTLIWLYLEILRLLGKLRSR
ncbi:Bax inhibitor-1/YccA family protein [Mucisphaera sp.]|uniref:Bax inhibitor-1/YccA family protein n=1 Tax=Mucisphaera sp. TaxID=2913024 RepID=UPI003D0DF47B